MVDRLGTGLVIGTFGGLICGWILARLSQKDALEGSSEELSHVGNRLSVVNSAGIGDPEEPLLRLAAVLRKHPVIDQAGARKLLAALPVAQRPSAGKGLAIFPGSFNPPHNLHLEMVKAACAVPGVDAMWLDMTMHRAKKYYVGMVEKERVRMADVAVEDVPKAAVTTLQGGMGDNGWSREYFDTLRVFVDGPDGGVKGQLLWVMGSDVVQSMQHYKEKATGLLGAVDRLIVFEREVHTREAILSIVEHITGWEKERVASFVVFQTLGPKAYVSSSLIRRYIVSLIQLVPIKVLQSVMNDRDLLEFYHSLYNQEDVKLGIVATSDQLLNTMKETSPRLGPAPSPAFPGRRGESKGIL